MLHTTEGIVLHSFKYGDTSLIAKILVPDYGVQSYIVKGVRKSRSRIKSGLFQPLTLVNMVAYHKEKEGLQNIKEIRCSHPFKTISTDIRKTSLAVFMAEVMVSAFRNQESNPGLFAFVRDKIIALDDLQQNVANFHLRFLLQLSGWLGFSPARNFSDSRPYFSMREGTYQSTLQGGDFLDRKQSRLLFSLSDSSLTYKEIPEMPGKMRRDLLYSILKYYRIHLEGFKDLRSLETLEAVFR